jgi:hypothetical protein
VPAIDPEGEERATAGATHPTRPTPPASAAASDRGSPR